MKKSIFLFFAAILCAIGMNAADITSDGTARLYFNMNAVSWWKSSNGENNFAYFFKDSNSAWSAHSVQHSGNTYYVIIPKGTWNTVILTRNDTKTSPSWSNKWNQTGDTPLSSTSNYISTFSDGGKGTFGTAVKPVSTASVSSSSSSVFVGAPANLTAALTSNADINTVKSVAYSTTTGASISGSTFTATAEGTYTVTATVTYHPNGYPSITSTATATTDITVTVPAEEVHDVTVSYMCGSTEIADETKISSVGVETEGDAVAPAKIKGYNFVNWTIGDGVINQTGDNTAREIKINTKSTGTYTLIANYEPETVYFVNTDEWAVVNVYAWVEDGIKNGEWPGEELTPTGEKIGGYDVYRYTSGEGYENVIFNDKVGSNASKQTPDLVWTNGKYYVYNGQTSVDADDWYAKVDVEGALPDWFATNVYLVGSMFANWDKTPDKEFRKATKDATTANIVVNLDANKEYELKVRRGDDWTSYTNKITNTVTGLQFSSSNNDNCKMKTTVAGDYTFTWTISSSKLDVTYPTLYAVTATANDAAMGTVAGAGNYGKGSTATLTATPNDGYLFVNWTKGGEVVATTQEYSFKVTEAVELVANFEAAPEEVHNVTVSYVCGGNKIADDQTVAAVGETTAKTVEAPAIFGYTFASWTLGAGVTSANELTSNTIDINIVAGGSDFTLTANYTEIPKVTVYFVNNKKWSRVYAYGWGGSVGENPAWPGQEITANKEAEQIAGFDVHSYSVVPGSYVNIKFTNNSGTESANFKWTDGKYYYMNAADNYVGGTAEEVATALGAIVSYDYYIYGNMNDWKEDANYGMTDENEDGIYEKTLTFKNNAEFKVKGTSWYGFEKVEGTYKETSDNGGNIKLTLGADTEVTVMFNSNTQKISFEGLTIDGDVVTYSYYIADNGSLSGNSNWSSKSIGLTDDNSYGIYEKTFTNQAIGTYLMKVTNGTWDEGYVWGFSDVEGAYKEVAAAASDNNIEIKLTAATTFTVKFNSNSKKISFDGLTPLIKQNLKYTVTVPKGTTKCYLVGLGDWNNFREMTQDPGNNRIFTLTVNDVYVTDEYKYSASQNWNNEEVKDASDNSIDNRTWSANDVVVKWKGIALVPEKLTYTVTVPAGTKQCYIAGDMNGWTAQSMTPGGANKFTISFDNVTIFTEYKYTCKDGEDRWAYVEKKNGNGPVDNRTYNANDVVERWNRIDISDGENAAIIGSHKGKGVVEVQVNRQFEAGKLYTLSLPFTMSEKSNIENIFGDGTIVYEFSKLEKDDEDLVLYFNDAIATIEAGKPYLIKPGQDVDGFRYENVDVDDTNKSVTNSVDGTTVTMESVLSVAANAMTNGKYWLASNNILYRTNTSLLSLRAVFDIQSTKANIRARVAFGENVETGFDNIITTDAPVKVIQNGQLIIIRDGVKYNVQGQKL